MTKTKKENVLGNEGISNKVNINIALSEELHKKLKLASIIQDKTLKDFVIDTLEEYSK